MLMGCDSVRPKTVKDFKTTAVKILNDRGNGGSGVIYKSSPEGTSILTNAHVCAIIASGGKIVYDKHYPIIKYKTSKEHDLCLIWIQPNLKVNTFVAPLPPEQSSPAFVSSYPSLYPHMVSMGHVSGKEISFVTYGYRECTEEELQKTPVVCIIKGKALMHRRWSQVVSALVSPGSSGGAVFDASGELIGLVYATKGDLGYALVVPWNYLYSFVKAEYKYLDWEYANKPLIPKYSNDGIDSIDNWEKIIDFIERKQQCLKFCPQF